MIEDLGKFYIYRHIRLDKNEPFYIGVGTKKSFVKNWRTKSAYYRANEKGKRNKIWWDIVNKSEYKIEILIESNDLDFIFEKEIEFVKLYGRINNKTGILANLTDGGRGSKKLVVSEDTKRLLSNVPKKKGKRLNFKMSKETKLIISLSRLGKKLTPESIEKRTKTRQSKEDWHSKESKQKIGKSNSKRLMRQNLETNEIEYYDSCHVAAKKVGKSFQRISAYCKDNISIKGYKWSYIEKIVK